MALNPKTVQIIKATAPVLADQGYNIARNMYKRMLPANPKVSELFNPTHQVVLPGEKKARQPVALSQSVLAYAQNIDNLAALGPAVEKIAEKHVSVHILPEHYPVVGENLLAAIKETLGDAATPEILQAWGEGYQFLADIFINRERELRAERANQPGGWEGWRDFIVKKKVAESSEITSFYLTPRDGNGIIGFRPGQYIGVRIETPKFTTQRNYSLSMAPASHSDQYRISVKKEGPSAPGCPIGAVSSYLHDEIQEGSVLKLSVPCGDFYLNEVSHNKPIVLISGGVGVTPLASMLEHLVRMKVPNEVVMVSCNRNKQVGAMCSHFQQFANENGNVKFQTVYEDENGFLDAAKLGAFVKNRDAHYYFCGPPQFMLCVRNILKEWEIPSEQVHYEFFGPNDSN